MSGSIPVFWVLVAFNVLFVGSYVVRKIMDRPPLPDTISYLAQGVFVAVNCLFLFQDEAQRYLNLLMRGY